MCKIFYHYGSYSELSTYPLPSEKPGLVKIMDDFMGNLLADARTRPFFEKADQARIKEQLVIQFCAVLGGPCTYESAPMGPLHASLGIQQEHFNALVEDLQLAMDKQGVPSGRRTRRSLAGFNGADAGDVTR